MDLSAPVLGAHVANQLRERRDLAVLVIGRDRFTRGDLATVACFNYVAAANLSRALTEVHAESTRDVFDHISPRALALPHIGAIALAVLGAAFEAKGIGGGTPLVNWVTKHRDPAHQHKDVVTFSTIKHRARDVKAAKKERRTAVARTHGRRAEAHRLRVKRFTERRVGQ